jgi:hypothetical protein
MTAKAICIQACLVAVIACGCAPQTALRPVTDSTLRLAGTGYSVLPPPGKGWLIERHGDLATSFGKVFPGKYHTFVAVVMVTKPEAKKVDSAAEFPKAVEEVLTQVTGRFRLISINVGPYGRAGSYCARYEMVGEEKDNPRAPGATLEMTTWGFVCLDASSEFMINAFYSERKPQRRPSLLDDALRQEGEAFLRNVVVTPLFERDRAAAASRGRPTSKELRCCSRRAL